MQSKSKSIIDFDTGKSLETIDSKLSFVNEKLKVISNPWTGNKKKLVIDIFRFLDDYGIQYNSILDLFSGSASVGLAAKLLDKEVITNDLMAFAYLNAIVFIENKSISLSDDEKEFLVNNNTPRIDNFVNDYYGPNGSVKQRFTQNEALFLDKFYSNVISMFGSPLSISGGNKIKASIAIVSILHHVMKCCFVGGRLNNGQVIADLSHRIDHPRNNGEEMKFGVRSLRWLPTLTYGCGKNFCYNMDAINLVTNIKPCADVCYVDPPYGGDQSDYANMYSFFDEYIYRQPISEISDLQSFSRRFVNKNEYEEHFRELLGLLDIYSLLVFSYNDSSWGSIDKIREVIGNFRSKISVTEVDYSYKYRERSSSREYIIIAE